MLGEQATAWRAPFAPPERIEQYRRGQLARIVRHAARKVPFYRELFRANGFDPFSRDDFQLADLPFASKAHLKQARFEDRLAEGTDLSQAVIAETSGSTGEPMRIVHTRQDAARLYGRRLRAQVLGGLRPWHRRVVLGSKPKLRWPHRLGIFPIEAIPIDLSAAETMQRLQEIRPAVLRGPASSLERLAEDHPREFAALRLHRVFSGAEQLSERGRRLIEQAARCRLLDFYGASECNLIAWECAGCGLYHTCDDSVMVEVLRNGRPVEPGEEGELFVTGLDGFAMPFLRYQVGDVVRTPLRPPPCAVRFGAIESIQGRVVDYLLLPDGRRLSPYVLMNELDELQLLRRYEAEQPEPARLIVRFQVEAGGCRDQASAQVLERCRKVIPREVSIDLKIQERFELDPTRKRRFVRSAAAHERVG